MQKKIIFIAIGSLILGILAYFSFVPNIEKQDAGQESGATTTITTTTATTTTGKDVDKTAAYTAKINKGEITIYLGGLPIGSVSSAVIGIPDASFASVHKIGKTGDQFLAIVHYSDNSADFGVISGKKLLYNSLTKNSGVKNVGVGIAFSPAKNYAAFQYVRDGGECKKDLMLGIIDLQTGKFSYPDVSRSYEADTGIWQIEMGGFRFDGETILQFVDMPRACNGAGDYDAQKYYSWNIKTGELEILSF